MTFSEVLRSTWRSQAFLYLVTDIGVVQRILLVGAHHRSGYADNSASGVLTNDCYGPLQRCPHSPTKLSFALEVSATFAPRSSSQVSQNDQRRPLSKTIDATPLQPDSSCCRIMSRREMADHYATYIDRSQCPWKCRLRHDRLDNALRVLASLSWGAKYLKGMHSLPHITGSRYFLTSGASLDID